MVRNARPDTVSGPTPRGRIVAGGMLRSGTPLEHYPGYGLWVKREDLACLPPGPQFSKTRGVYARVASRSEGLVGALDTYHSQAGHAVARACQILGKKCLNYYPEFLHEPGPRSPQLRAAELGAELIGIKAGRSAILYHVAKKGCEALGGYMMPNALKLEESVIETAKECPESGEWDTVVIPASSGTIAAGVVRGMQGRVGQFIVHLGYTRSHTEMREYIIQASGVIDAPILLIDDGYTYRDQARSGPSPQWPCNLYYDLKAFRWWMNGGAEQFGGRVLFWNIG